MANEVVVSFSEQLTDKLVSVSDALPKEFNRTRFVQNALAVLNDKPELAKVNKQQLIGGLMKAAYLGLDPMNKECYLIPYGNSVQFQTDYKGEKKLVKKYSIRPIKDIYAKVVRKGDVFINEIVNNIPNVTFKPVPFSNEEIVGAFAMVIYEDGQVNVEDMSKEEINSVRNNYSKASQSKAWKNSWDEMAKKTVLRRLCKHIEIDFESTEAKMAWDDGAGMDFTHSNKPQSNGDVVDAFDENVIDGGDITEIPSDVLNEADEVFG